MMVVIIYQIFIFIIHILLYVGYIKPNNTLVSCTCRRAALQHTATKITVLLGSNPDLYFIPVLGPTSHWRASGLMALRIKR